MGTGQRLTGLGHGCLRDSYFLGCGTCLQALQRRLGLGNLGLGGFQGSLGLGDGNLGVGHEAFGLGDLGLGQGHLSPCRFHASPQWGQIGAARPAGHPVVFRLGHL